MMEISGPFIPAAPQQPAGRAQVAVNSLSKRRSLYGHPTSRQSQSTGLQQIEHTWIQKCFLSRVKSLAEFPGGSAHMSCFFFHQLRKWFSQKKKKKKKQAPQMSLRNVSLILRSPEHTSSRGAAGNQKKGRAGSQIRNSKSKKTD